MSIVQIIILAAMVGLLLWRSVQAWRNTTADLDRYGASVQRALPAFTVGFCVMLGTALLVIALPEDEGAFVELIQSATLVVWLACLWLMVSVYRTGRPEWLVPPHLREDATRRR